MLRAWDAADEYLLNYIAEDVSLTDSSKVLILNDSFGVLAVALHQYQPFLLSDSWLSQQATRENMQANELSLDDAQMCNNLVFPQAKFDLILIKVPKTLALLEYQLIKLRENNINNNSKIILAGMIKNIPPSVWKLCEKILGDTTTSLAKKKSRLIFVSLNDELDTPENPFPTCYTLENTNYKICNHANVFSRESLDIGTRFFLQHLPEKTGAHDVIDLGCGNGVVGLIAAELNPEAKVYFIDESFMAVESARDNFQRAFSDSRDAEFIACNGLVDFESNSADLILCNPPFHQQHAVGDQIAQEMFRQSRRVLREQGELWVIGNRHLGYHLSLKKIFGNIEQVAANKKFVIFKSKR